MSDENIDYIPENLRYLRNKLGLTQEQMAKRLGMNRTHYSNYENNLREPNLGMISKMYDYLSIIFDFDNPTDFIFKNLEEEEINKGSIKKKDTVKVPVLGIIPAGIPFEAIEDIIDYEEIPKDWCKGNKEFFGLLIKGDSMSPKYLDNDIVIFEKTNDCENGDEVAVFVNGDDCTFKKVFKHEHGITIQPLNPMYEPKTYSNEEIKTLPITIIGKAKELRRKL